MDEWIGNSDTQKKKEGNKTVRMSTQMQWQQLKAALESPEKTVPQLHFGNKCSMTAVIQQRTTLPLEYGGQPGSRCQQLQV